MKKIFAVIGCVLLGCTIIPDDSFENLPEAILSKVTIESNTNNGGLTPETLTGTVVATATKTTITWDGALDPFYFVFPVQQLEYTFSSENLLTGITISAPNGYTVTESFTYNALGHLLNATTSYEDYLYTHTFYYKNNVLDSIAKTVQHDGETFTGFFKRTGTNPVKYISVFPYNPEYPYNEETMNGCSGFFPQNDNDYNSSTYEFSAAHSEDQMRGTRFQFSSPFISNDTYFTNVLQESYYQVYSTVERRVVEARLDVELTCMDVRRAALNPYLLIPERNEQYGILAMLNAAEELYWLRVEPGRLSDYTDLKVTYDYTFEK